MAQTFVRLVVVAVSLAFATLSAFASVQCVQQGLTNIGYDPGPVDGLLGQRTTDMASNFGRDHGINLPRLTAANTEDWCTAVRRVEFGVAAIELEPANIEPGAPTGTVPPQCTFSPSDTYAREIRNMVDGDELTLRVSARFGGAVESVRWRGKEFINIFDHGRQISYAWAQNDAGGCLNPTEPGSADDLFDQSSSTQLLSVCSQGPNQLTTNALPAYWLSPGQGEGRDGYCSGGVEGALNDSVRAEDELNKSIEIGYRGIDNVIVFDTSITLMEDFQVNQLEIPTAYLTYEFTKFWRFDPSTGELTEAPGEPVVEPWSFQDSGMLPPILATPDGEYAMGAYTAEPILTYQMLLFNVPNPNERTTKWNMVIREEPAPAGDYHYLSFAIVGTLVEVQVAMRELYAFHPTDFHPPVGYVDLANCSEIAGWAWDPKAPDQPVDIEIYRVAENGDRTLLHRATADHFRQDLPPVLNDNGRHGYFIATDQVISNPGPHDLVVEIVNSVNGLPNRLANFGHQTLDCPARLG